MNQFLDLLRMILLAQYPQDSVLFPIFYYVPPCLAVVAGIGIIIMILCNEPLRKRTRIQDRMIFRECILMLCEIGITFYFMLYTPISEIDGIENHTILLYVLVLAYLVLLVIDGAIDLLLLLQWLVCVDYSLYRSVDHIKLRYRHAIIPIIVVTAMKIGFFIAVLFAPTVFFELLFNNLRRLLECCYFLTAVVLVKRYEKERREPQFLRIDAFIVPFFIGVVIIFLKEILFPIGIMATYSAMKKRDEFIEPGTGLYKDSYLDYICSYWDKKGFADGHALLLKAPGHDKELAQILTEIEINDCFIIRTGPGEFVILTQLLRKSAILMTQQMLEEAAGGSETPFVINMRSLARKEGQSMSEFSAEIRKTMSGPIPPVEGGEQIL